MESIRTLSRKIDYLRDKINSLKTTVCNLEKVGGTETDPLFTASPAANITQESIAQWDSNTLPVGTNREVAVFDETSGEIVAGRFRPNHWSEINNGAPTESGTWVASFTNSPVNPSEDMFFTKATLIPEFGSVPVYDQNGELFVNTGTDDNHAANRGDLNTKVNVTSLSTGATVNTVPLRKSNGRVETGTAIDGADAINKTQFDSALANKADVVDNKIPETLLPSYVDSVQEYSSLAGLPTTGVSNVVYLTIDTNKPYRWGGTAYTEITSGMALGDTSSTAYRGDRGKIAYDYAVSHNNVNNTSDINKPVSTPQANALALKVNFPTLDNHVPIRGNSGNQTSLEFTSAAYPNTIVSRNVGGMFGVNNPTSGSHPVNKTYFDGYKIGTSTITDGVKKTEFTNRTEYTCKISFSHNVAAPPSHYSTQATSFILPVGVTIDGCDEHYISIRNDNRAVHINVYDDTSRRITLGLYNSWSNSANVATGSVFIKLIKYK